eukprot:TRINITY_DN2264_c0_g4_i4.p1 TRINITY_DN2264_c0_g4~~TRINITY_DN2264_c0_g4_i4.p1  ORF type:complete len:441 (+),score=60.98 TRINITY_DN2264_c0_g4_i4:238-1560(+)
MQVPPLVGRLPHWRAVTAAVGKVHFSIVKYLVECIPPDTPPSSICSTLHPALVLSARRGYSDLFAYFLSIPGVDLNRVAGQALLWSARNGHEHIVQQILSQTEVCADEYGFAPLIDAASFGHLSVIQRLLPTYREQKLYAAARLNAPLTAAVRAGHVDVVQWFLQLDGVRQGSLRRPVVAAAKYDRLEMLHILIDSLGARISESILQDAAKEACAAGHMRCLDYLLARCPATAWMLVAAAGHGHLAIVKKLTPDMIVKYPYAAPEAVKTATESGQLHVVDWFLCQYPQLMSPELLFQAVKLGQESLVVYFLSKHPLDYQPQQIADSLQKAVEATRFSVADHLLCLPGVARCLGFDEKLNQLERDSILLCMAYQSRYFRADLKNRVRNAHKTVFVIMKEAVWDFVAFEVVRCCYEAPIARLVAESQTLMRKKLNLLKSIQS